MAAYTIDANEFSRTKAWKAEPANQSSMPLPSDTLIARTAVTPKTRIVVVRTTSSIQDENGQEVAPEEPTRSKSVELPPMFTNGRTSVYLIRRPIPPTDAPKETLFYQSNDIEERKRRKTTTTRSYGSRSPTPTEDIEDTQVPLTGNPMSTFESRTAKDHTDSPTVHSPDNTRSRSPNEHRSSPTQTGTSQRNKRRSRSRSKSRTRGLAGSTPRHRSRSTKQRVSPEHHSPTSPPASAPPATKQEESIEPTPKRKLSSSSQTKNIAVQADLTPTVTERRTTRTGRAPGPRRLRRRKSNISRSKSPRSVQLAHSDDPTTITEIEDLSPKRDTTKTSLKSNPNSVKHTRFSEETDNQSTEELMQTSRWQKCFGCLLRHMCIIVLICLILILIGLAGIGVSAYFLATDSQTDLIPKIVGIVIGGVLVIVALCFLCCILGCFGSREGYFKYNGDGQRKGGRAFALISPAHPNAHRYIPADYSELSEYKPTSASTIINSQPSTITTIHRQRTIFPEGKLSTTNSKNVTIEMPERLLTGRKMSPKSHERKLNKVVHHIGHVVADRQKRYPGEGPTKVIVKMDEHVKATV